MSSSHINRNNQVISPVQQHRLLKIGSTVCTTCFNVTTLLNLYRTFVCFI